MARIVILGAGVMGSAMAFPAAAAGNSVTLLGTHLDEEIIERVAAGEPHPRLGLRTPRGVVALPHGGFDASLMRVADLIILGVSSAGVDWAIEKLNGVLRRPVPVLMVTKGLAPEGNRIGTFPERVSRAVERQLGLSVPVMAVAGPCIAGELAACRDTCVVITGAEGTPVEQVIETLRATFYHPRSSGDVVGVEVCAAFKNFFAVGVGTAAGWLERDGEGANGALMHNVAASLFDQAVREMAVLAAALGGDPASAYGMPGLGNLYVTCQAGRNSRLGRWLGLGLTYREAKKLHMAEETVEGAELAMAVGPILRAMMADGRLDPARLPMTTAILDALLLERPFGVNWAAFHQP